MFLDKIGSYFPNHSAQPLQNCRTISDDDDITRTVSFFSNNLFSFPTGYPTIGGKTIMSEDSHDSCKLIKRSKRSELIKRYFNFSITDLRNQPISHSNSYFSLGWGKIGDGQDWKNPENRVHE